MIRNIIQYPDKRLLQPSTPVTLREDGSYSDEVRAVISDLFQTMVKGRGYALAAVQIGESINVIAVDPKMFYGFTVLVNPEIIKRGHQIETAMEGCMSIGMGRPRFQVRRHRVITVKFLDKAGIERVQVAKGLPARIVQHEIDHLAGKLILG